MSEGSVAAQQKLGTLSNGRVRLLELLLERESVKIATLGPRPRNPGPGRDLVPASGAQQRLWFIDQLEGAGAVYHVPLAVSMHGELDRAALQRALDALVCRHEVLRTAFVKEEQGELLQEIAAESRFALQSIDLTALTAIEQEAQVARQSREELAAPFDLRVAPLIRGRLVQLSADVHLLLITMHHIISDGWSIGVFVRELGALYAAYREGRADRLPPLSIQYADYAAWQRQWLAGPQSREHLKYWESICAKLLPC